ncbi:MAG: entericidin EcnA/B family protein [Rhodobacterales bacterium]|nr:entericidin EcnA/B family protein [Rhodobacterales bacterium]
MRQFILLATLAALLGCNTVEGAGRDISGAARGVKSLF